MQRKRLFAFSLAIGMLASFITLRFHSAPVASAQDAKLKREGFIIGCSETVIDALDERIQERFSKSDQIFGYERVAPRTRHLNRFVAETQSESDVISELEKDGWQVAFYLVGRHVLGQKPDFSEHKWRYGVKYPPIIHGPVAITAISRPEEIERGPARDSTTGSLAIFRDIYNYNEEKLIEQFELPEPMSIWDDARRAMLAFEKSDQYDFSFGKWDIAARPIRAKEACLKCHTGDPAATQGALRRIYLDGGGAPGLEPPKVGDALGVAMYAYARKQKITSTLR